MRMNLSSPISSKLIIREDDVIRHFSKKVILMSEFKPAFVAKYLSEDVQDVEIECLNSIVIVGVKSCV